jgi:hypothetical protein
MATTGTTVDPAALAELLRSAGPAGLTAAAAHGRLAEGGHAVPRTALVARLRQAVADGWAAQPAPRGPYIHRDHLEADATPTVTHPVTRAR